jgi:hypothetical protein
MLVQAGAAKSQVGPDAVAVPQPGGHAVALGRVRPCRVEPDGNVLPNSHHVTLKRRSIPTDQGRTVEVEYAADVSAGQADAVADKPVLEQEVALNVGLLSVECGQMAASQHNHAHRRLGQDHRFGKRAPFERYSPACHRPPGLRRCVVMSVSSEVDPEGGEGSAWVAGVAAQGGSEVDRLR